MRRLLTLMVIFGLLAVACGADGGSGTTEPAAEGEESTQTSSTTIQSDDGEGGSEPSEPAAEAGSGDGECTITVSGDLEETVAYPQSIYSFTTEYWATEEDLRDVVEFLGEDAAGGSYEEIVARGEPIVGWFAYNCVPPDDLGTGVIVLPTNDTTSDQFPMGPGTYEVSGGLFDATGPASTVITGFAAASEEQFGPIPGSGELVISRWDLEAVEGTVTFDAVEAFAEGEPREVNVSVEFVVTCVPEIHSACR